MKTNKVKLSAIEQLQITAQTNLHGMATCSLSLGRRLEVYFLNGGYRFNLVKTSDNSFKTISHQEAEKILKEIK